METVTALEIGLVSSIYEYTGQSDNIKQIRHFVMQSSCSPNLLVQYFARVLA